MIKKQFIKRKINLIYEDLIKLAEFKKFTFDEVAKDFYKHCTVERLLEKIIMRAIDINQHLIAELWHTDMKTRFDYTETFLALKKLKVYPEKFAKDIAQSAGLRNALIHDYDDIDDEMLLISVGKALKQYDRYCGYVLKFIGKG